MIGFKNPIHHGWRLQLMGTRDLRSPYPAGSTADQDFWVGARRAQLGQNWDGENVGASRRKRDNPRVHAS